MVVMVFGFFLYNKFYRSTQDLQMLLGMISMKEKENSKQTNESNLMLFDTIAGRMKILHFCQEGIQISKDTLVIRCIAHD